MNNRPSMIPVYNYDPKNVSYPSIDGMESRQNLPPQMQETPAQYQQVNQAPVFTPHQPVVSNQGYQPVQTLPPGNNNYNSPYQHQPQQSQPNSGLYAQNYNPYSYNNPGPAHRDSSNVVVIERTRRRDNSSKDSKFKFNSDFFIGLLLGLFFSVYSLFCLCCNTKKSFVVGILLGVAIGIIIGIIMGTVMRSSRHRD